MRYALLAVIVVALTACGAYRFPSGPSAGIGTVTGQVTAVPCSPVVAPQMICKGRPVADLDIVFTSDTGSVVVARTDSNGSYSAQLDAGTWKVSLKGYLRIINGPQTVTVDSGATVVANYVVDSGIREPVPAPAANPGA